jgi:succinate-acetate transporter protein
MSELSYFRVAVYIVEAVLLAMIGTLKEPFSQRLMYYSLAVDFVLLSVLAFIRVTSLHDPGYSVMFDQVGTWVMLPMMILTAILSIVYLIYLRTRI